MEKVTGSTGIGDGCTNGPGTSGSTRMLIFDVMYFHGYTMDGARFTVAGLIENEELRLGIALCAPTDHFCKEKGRTIAAGRVLNQRRSPKGFFVTSVYALPADSQFITKDGGFPKDYYKGNELKIFKEVVYEYGYYTRKELMDEFNLSNRS